MLSSSLSSSQTMFKLSGSSKIDRYGLSMEPGNMNRNDNTNIHIPRLQANWTKAAYRKPIMEMRPLTHRSIYEDPESLNIIWDKEKPYLIVNDVTFRSLSFLVSFGFPFLYFSLFIFFIFYILFLF